MRSGRAAKSPWRALLAVSGSLRGDSEEVPEHRQDDVAGLVVILHDQDANVWTPAVPAE
jgi:hypothetical protein